MELMLPIQSFNLAHTIFHEVGHHIQHTKSHGVKKRKGEKFAESYALKLMNGYILDKADQINTCFDTLDRMADEKGMSIDIIENMKEAWAKKYQTALSMSDTLN